GGSGGRRRSSGRGSGCAVPARSASLVGCGSCGASAPLVGRSGGANGGSAPFVRRHGPRAGSPPFAGGDTVPDSLPFAGVSPVAGSPPSAGDGPVAGSPPFTGDSPVAGSPPFTGGRAVAGSLPFAGGDTVPGGGAPFVAGWNSVPARCSKSADGRPVRPATWSRRASARRTPSSNSSTSAR